MGELKKKIKIQKRRGATPGRTYCVLSVGGYVEFVGTDHETLGQSRGATSPHHRRGDR